MPTRDRINYDDATQDGSAIPTPNGHYTAARFRERIRPDDPRGGGFDPNYAMMRMLDGHLIGVGPLTDAQANHLVGPDNDLPVSTDSSNWADDSN